MVERVRCARDAGFARVVQSPMFPRSGLGFPMFQTLLGGMELTGTLLGGGGFAYFFNELAKDKPEYGKAHKVLWSAARNTLAHGYLLHTGIRISKSGKNHLTATDAGEIHIDLLTLHADFLSTYTRLMDEVSI